MKQNGFILSLIIFIVIGLVAVGGGAYYFISKNSGQSPPQLQSALLAPQNIIPETSPVAENSSASPENLSPAQLPIQSESASNPVENKLPKMPAQKNAAPQPSAPEPAAPAPTPAPAPAPAFVPASAPQKYILTFHACDTSKIDCMNPRNHKAYLAQSTDGANWSLFPNFTPFYGSVPDAIRRGNTLYIYTPGNITRYHLDTGVVEPTTFVRLMNSDGSPFDGSFVDPSPIYDSDGKIVLFYLLGQMGSDPARCAPGVSSCVKFIKSATEVAGSDGTKFIVDSGNRAEITINDQNDTASDPDIFKDPNGYVLYISRGPNVQALTSINLRGAFQNIPTLLNGMLISNNSGGVPAGFYNSTAKQYWTYVTSNGVNGVGIIRRAVSDSITLPLSDSQFSAVISGASIGLGNSFTIESPGFGVNK